MRSNSFPTRYYIYLCDVVAQSGTDTTTLLEKAGLPADALESPSTFLATAQVEALIEAARDTTGRNDLGLLLGKTLKLSSHGVIGFAFLSSPTLDYALRLAAQYFALILPPFSVRYRPDENGVHIDIAPNSLMNSSCLFFHLELLASAFHWEMRELVDNRMPAYDLYLPYPAPAHQKRYREMVEARCHFATEGLAGIRFALPQAMVQRPLKLADPLALKDAEARCKEMVHQAVSRREVGEWVEMLLTETSGPLPKMDRVAADLNMSARSLDRYLRKEGVTYRQLANRAQHKKACRLLSTTNLPVTQIAYELGYSDVSNFARSFRREAGLSPNEWRAQNQKEKNTFSPPRGEG